MIENTLNDKKYIGITTTSLSTRFYHQKVEASKKGSRSKLYNAMRKLGVNEFSISILRNDASNIEELLHQETKTILDFDSITNGYNTSTGGTLGTAKSLEVDGKYFESYGQAAIGVYEGVGVNAKKGL